MPVVYSYMNIEGIGYDDTVFMHTILYYFPLLIGLTFGLIVACLLLFLVMMGVAHVGLVQGNLKYK